MHLHKRPNYKRTVTKLGPITYCTIVLPQLFGSNVNSPFTNKMFNRLWYYWLLRLNLDLSKPGLNLETIQLALNHV